jgi:hypothetical protein
VEYPTTLDILVARLSAIEARRAQLEGHAAVAVTVGSRDLQAALAKLGDAIACRDRGDWLTGAVRLPIRAARLSRR